MKGKNAVQTVLKHLNDPPQPFSKLGLKEKIPSDLEKIILHCLEKSPALRYSSVVELGKDLRRLSDGKPISLNTIGSGITATSKYLWSMTIVMASLLALCWLLPTLVNTFSPSLATKIGKGSGIPQMDAERLDQLAFEYFVKGDYERAIPLLEFGIKTYQDKSLKNRQATTFQQNTYLADNYQHIGLCYLRLKKAETAAPYYQKALIIYKSIGNNKNTMMSEAVENYAEVLRRMNKSAQAQVMLDEFRQTGNITTVPGS
jgi:tetratricopeptide (TPR) repeat protein